jgi:hypothetical protein
LTRGFFKIEVHAEVNDTKDDSYNLDEKNCPLSPARNIFIQQRLLDVLEPNDSTPHGKHNARICGWFEAQRKTNPTTCAC